MFLRPQFVHMTETQQWPRIYISNCPVKKKKSLHTEHGLLIVSKIPFDFSVGESKGEKHPGAQGRFTSGNPSQYTAHRESSCQICVFLLKMAH